MNPIKCLIRFSLALLILSAATVASAQAATTATAQWTQVEPVATAQTFQYSIKIDVGAVTNLTAVCASVNNVTTCSANLVGYVVGNHTVVLTASNSNGAASTTFNVTPGPSAPGAPKIIVIITGDDN